MNSDRDLSQLIEQRQAKLGRELLAGLWVSEGLGHIIVERLQFDLRIPEAKGTFAQESPVVLPFDSSAERIGLTVKAALVDFTGTTVDWMTVTGENHPGIRAAQSGCMAEFVSAYRHLDVRTEGHRLQIWAGLFDDSDESIDLCGELWVVSDAVELGNLIRRVFRTAQLVVRAGLP